jgi:hypothetical protein
MKILRILVMTACLNIPSAHAIEPSVHEFILNAAIVTAGVLSIVEGCSNAQFGTSPFLPLGRVSDNQFVDRTCKAVVGVAQAGLGLSAIAYALE